MPVTLGATSIESSNKRLQIIGESESINLPYPETSSETVATASTSQFLGNFNTIGSDTQIAYVLICKRDTSSLIRKFNGKIFGARRSGNTQSISADLLVSDGSAGDRVSYALNTTNIQGVHDTTSMVSLTYEGSVWLALQLKSPINQEYDSTGIWASWMFKSEGISLLLVRPANVSSVTAYNSFHRAAFQGGIGWNQSWTDVTASRVINTTYTNATNQAILISIVAQVSGNNAATYTILVDNVTVSAANTGSQVWRDTVNIIVPAGSTYRFNRTGSAAIYHWAELR